jgi:hypothetical protein
MIYADGAGAAVLEINENDESGINLIFLLLIP